MLLGREGVRVWLVRYQVGNCHTAGWVWWKTERGETMIGEVWLAKEEERGRKEGRPQGLRWIEARN